MGTISKNFSYSEFERSETAEKKGIVNVIATARVRDSIQALVLNVLQPLRTALGAEMHINSGYRCPELNEAVGGVPNSQHCFDAETEVLTDKGWATLNTIDNNDCVYSYNIGNGCIELVPIVDIVKYHYKGKMVCIKSLHTDMMVTDRHRMLVRYDSHKYKRRGNNRISDRGQLYFDSLKTENDKYHIELAVDIFGRRRRFMCAGNTPVFHKVDMPLLKMCMAAIADGFFWFNRKSVSLGFRFKKERKCSQLESLLNELGWYYTKSLDKNGVYNYYIRSYYAGKVYDVIGPYKIIPAWILNVGGDNLRELVRYYSLYDGYSDKRKNCEGFSISSSVKENVDMLQAMCALSGMRSQYTRHEAGIYNIMGMTGISKASYHLSINPNKYETKVKENSFSLVDYDGLVWCVNNKNTTLVIRRNGKISIQGNCKGEAADVATPTPLRLARKAVEMGLPFDQIGVYPTFVHFSHRLGGPQRGQIFYSKNYKGERL